MVAKGRSLTILPTQIVSIAYLFLSLIPLLVDSQCTQNPIIFNFGDSNSDTGGFAAALGHSFGPPNGRLYFHHPSGRLCDGRLILDFLCESLGIENWTPYLESLRPNFTYEANFAISGSSALPGLVPFSLSVQVLQFLRFRTRSLELISKGYQGFVNEEEFKRAVYTIDMGQNDIASSFFYFPYAKVIGRIPSFITEIENAIWLSLISEIYQHGGRNLWVHNTEPLGCFPQQLATTGTYATDFDQCGCLESLNNAAKAFNKQLQALCDELRSDQMMNAMIVYVDIYTIKYDLIANSDEYGFENPLMAYCGYGGPPYNYNPNVTCGQTRFNVCIEELSYVSWDGVRYTEAGNAIFASKILSTHYYSTPQIGFGYFCNA
ncbi:GDSL esterase/lipase LIP-4 [Morella rubra]|uniref:GDSL esterase/lipase LIP-4 n=1 Tax=Morella rubra TaxID=262757 RepID=A0A6A1UJY3_9ROSI|nr:GDSL esterase/lipase LIP-4 [Morella rubra]